MTTYHWPCTEGRCSCEAAAGVQAGAVIDFGMRASEATCEVTRFEGLESAVLTGARLMPRALRNAIEAVALGQHNNTIVKDEVRAAYFLTRQEP